MARAVLASHSHHIVFDTCTFKKLVVQFQRILVLHGLLFELRALASHGILGTILVLLTTVTRDVNFGRNHSRIPHKAMTNLGSYPLKLTCHLVY